MCSTHPSTLCTPLLALDITADSSMSGQSSQGTEEAKAQQQADTTLV